MIESRHGVVSTMVRAAVVLLAASLGAVGCAPPDEAKSDIESGKRNYVYANGIYMTNGLKLANGYQLKNGVRIANGLRLSNGIDFSNGVRLSNGIKYVNGYDETDGLDDVQNANFDARQDNDLYEWIKSDEYMNTLILKYLVECAMPAGVEVDLQMDGYVQALGYGVGGLGPSLQYGEMSDQEQQRVSACILARVNAKGEVVQIDTFGPYPGFDSASPEEMATWRVGEATFFGNIFADPPQAFMTYAGSTARSECTTRACLRPDGSCDCGIIQPITNAGCTKNTIGGTRSSFYTDCYDPSGNYYHDTISVRVAAKPSGQECSLSYQCASGRCSVTDGNSVGYCL